MRSLARLFAALASSRPDRALSLASGEASASSSSAASAPEKVSSSPAATHSAADSGNGTTWGTIVAVLAGVVIIGFIVAAVVLHSKSKKMRDEVWNNEGASPTPVKNSDDGTSSHE